MSVASDTYESKTYIRSFAYASPSNWNSLPAHLTDNSLCLSSFK